jgi:F-type H+-transporting ATPase subunit delta
MADAKVAKRYAQALFNSAVKANVIDSVEADLNAIAGLVESHPQFRGFLASPRISRDDKITIAETLFSDRVTALTMSLLRLMLVKRREAEFAGVREEYVNLRRAQGNVLYASVVSAEPLDDATRQALVNKLEQKSGKRVEADYRVDPNLLGGVKVALGNYVLDGSVRGSFNRLRDRLKYDLLKQN